MLHRSERILDNIPVGSLGIIAVDGCEEMGNKVNDYLVKWRKEETRFQKDNLVFNGYEKPNYLINAKVPRFGSGEAKGIINESVRGKDLYLMVDVCNYSLKNISLLFLIHLTKLWQRIQELHHYFIVIEAISILRKHLGGEF